MSNDMDPPLQYHTEYFHCPKNPLFNSGLEPFFKSRVEGVEEVEEHHPACGF